MTDLTHEYKRSGHAGCVPYTEARALYVRGLGWKVRRR